VDFFEQILQKVKIPQNEAQFDKEHPFIHIKAIYGYTNKRNKDGSKRMNK